MKGREGQSVAGPSSDRNRTRRWTRPSFKQRFLLPIFAMATVSLVACGSGPAESATTDPAPDFDITLFQGQETVGGEQVSMSQLLGTQPIVLNFWAGLCPPCRAEMPDLQEFYDEFSDSVLLLGVDLGQFIGLGSPEDAQELLDELRVTYPAGSTNDAGVIPDYRVLGMPTTVFIDGNGKIFNKWTGALNLDVLREQTTEMLNQ